MLAVALPADHRGLTLSLLAEAKGLPDDFLVQVGVRDGSAGAGPGRTRCVDIPYTDEKGEIVGIRKRLSLEGAVRFAWRRGDRATLYGLRYLKEIRRTGYVVLLEGETDTWTLWLHRFSALGIPGASMWNQEFRYLLIDLDVYLWHERDEGGDELFLRICSDLPDVRVIESPEGVKDASELYLQDPGGFKERISTLMSSARPASELRAEAFTKEARESLAVAQPLLRMPDIISRLVTDIALMGYAGDARPVVIAYVSITSRLLEEPMNLAYISPSAAGKNAAIDGALPFLPKGAYYLVRASSPRALVYNDEVFTHKTVILTEADSLPEDGPAASAMRSLMSDREMTYEVVEKGEDGRHVVRQIVKPGPTGLITTSIKPLGDQASTRTLTVSIPDSPEQTRLVLQAQADRSNFAVPSVETEHWLAVQRWLELAGERRVVVPFARALVELLPVGAVRVRRDFPQLLTVIKTLAFLHQLQRERDSDGRTIATLDDYANAAWLLEEVFTASVREGLSNAVRETVEAVRRLCPERGSLAQKELVRELSLSPSTVSYRVHRALDGGWLVNMSTKRGSPAMLVPGEPLPDRQVLPSVEALSVCADTSGTSSNSRTQAGDPVSEAMDADSRVVRTGSKGDSNSREASHSRSEGEFEVFEPFRGGVTHTDAPNLAQGEKLPWDDFVAGIDGDDPDSN